MEESCTPMRFIAPILMCLAMVAATVKTDHETGETKKKPTFGIASGALGMASDGSKGDNEDKDDDKKNSKNDDNKNASSTYGLVAAIVLLVASISM